MRFFYLLLFVLLILPIACLVLRPNLENMDVLSLDLTMFSLAVAIMTFLTPTLLKIREKLLEIDLLSLKNKKSYQQILDTNVEYLEKVDEESGCYEHRDTIDKGKEAIKILNKEIENPALISSDITKIFDAYHDYMKWCIFAIVLEITIVEVFFSSYYFRFFAKESLSVITAYLPLNTIKVFMISYLKLVSLTLTLFFLIYVSNDMLYVVKKFKQV